MTQKTFEDLLKELSTDAQLPTDAMLHLLSNLHAPDVARLQDVWGNLPVDVRRKIIARLLEIAEADFEVNFVPVFAMSVDDTDAEVRTVAIDGLWEDQDIRLIPQLIERLHTDESISVRSSAAKSLGRFILLGELEKIRARPRDLVYDALLQAYRTDEAIEVRRRAVESLAYTETEVVNEIIETAYHAPEEKMRVSAIFAMGRSANPRWCEEVCREFFSPNPELRYEAARACGELQIEEAVTDIEELTQDADPEIVEAALWTLGQIGGEKAREILERFCLSDNESFQDTAEAALDQLEFLHGDLDDLFRRLADQDRKSVV